MNIVFKGISSFSFSVTKRNITLSDEELIKRDILNALFTSKGSVPKNRNFGTILPTLLMKQMTDDLIQQAQYEITSVLSKEPRIRVLNIDSKTNYEEKRLDFIITFSIVTFPASVSTIDLFLTFTG